MAASSLVGESMTEPGRITRTTSSRRSPCFGRCRRPKIQMLVFSSTAAVYGEPERQPISERRSNRALQHLRRDEARGRARDAAGTTPRTACAMCRCGISTPPARRRVRGERHDPETHLIPLVLRAAQDAQCQCHRVRRRLPDPRRHVRARLRARVRSGARARVRRSRRLRRTTSSTTCSISAAATDTR